MGTENADKEIQDTNSEEKVVSDNQDTNESNEEVKVGIFITEDIEDLDENESSLPLEVSESAGVEAVSETEVDPPEPAVSIPEESSKEDPVRDTDEEGVCQEKDHQNENTIQVEEEKK